MRMRIVAVAAVAMASACGGGSPEGLYFPRFQAQGSQPLAALTGTIRQEGRCLLIDNPIGVDDSTEENLALWSSSFRAVDSGDGITVTDGGGRLLAREGMPAVFGGGHYGAEHLEFLEGLVGAIPAECQRPNYYAVHSFPSDE